jgi:hypothetical protein
MAPILDVIGALIGVVFVLPIFCIILTVSIIAFALTVYLVFYLPYWLLVTISEGSRRVWRTLFQPKAQPFLSWISLVRWRSLTNPYGQADQVMNPDDNFILVPIAVVFAIPILFVVIPLFRSSSCSIF